MRFVKEGLRLNVAMSRCIDHFVLVYDFSALNLGDRHQLELEQLASEIDPMALAKSLAKSDINGDEDEDENRGKGKGCSGQVHPATL